MGDSSSINDMHRMLTMTSDAQIFDYVKKKLYDLCECMTPRNLDIFPEFCADVRKCTDLFYKVGDYDTPFTTLDRFESKNIGEKEAMTIIREKLLHLLREVHSKEYIKPTARDKMTVAFQELLTYLEKNLTASTSTNQPSQLRPLPTHTPQRISPWQADVIERLEKLETIVLNLEKRKADRWLYRGAQQLSPDIYPHTHMDTLLGKIKELNRDLVLET